MLKRGMAAVLGSVAAALTLTGCGVPVGSAVAIGVDAEGGPVGYVLVCQGTADSVSLWKAKTQDYAGGWDSPQVLNSGAFASVNLNDPSGGWRTSDTAFTGITPGKRYEFRAYGGHDGDAADSDQWSSTYVYFDTKTLAVLKPGQVRYWAGTQDDKDVFETVTVDEFKAKGCKPVTGS